MKSSLWKILLVLTAIILGAALLVPKALRDKSGQGAEPITAAAQGANDLAGIKPASLGFHEVMASTPEIIDLCASQQKCPLGIKAYPYDGDAYLLLKERPDLTQADVKKFSQGIGYGSKQPIVNFKFSKSGTQKFCDFTGAHIDRKIAIVLNGDVISAPYVNEPICGGRGQLSSNFSLKEAKDLVRALNAGTTPAKQRPVD